MFGDRFHKVMDTLDRAAIEDFYAPDALLDANVPSWRFQRRGLDDITQQYAQWFPVGVTVLSLREWPAPFGSVIETSQREPDGKGGELYSRQMHVMFADGDRVERHVMYCTGTWNAETVARQKSEAPIYDA